MIDRLTALPDERLRRTTWKSAYLLCGLRSTLVRSGRWRRTKARWADITYHGLGINEVGTRGHPADEVGSGGCVAMMAPARRFREDLLRPASLVAARPNTAEMGRGGLSGGRE